MRGYAKVASVGFLMMGLLAVPNLSPAGDRDGNGRHSLLNSELRAKIEHLRDRMANHREHHHNQRGNTDSVAALREEVTDLQKALAEMAKNEAALLLIINNRLNALETSPPSGGTTNPTLTELVKYVKVDPNPINGLKGPHVIFHHANVHVQSGSGTTFGASALTGLGNLIVGYDEELTVGSRVGSGSHNLVVGPFHTYTSNGGAVFGEQNMISAQSASVLGGLKNQAEGDRSSILGSHGYRILPMQPETTFP
ncbi:MAG TPA: hypothetical protein VJT11_08785 [Nitrospiraceae bacterium]|nr:hypothetical protein [Nitrospiraceae bacterium]